MNVLDFVAARLAVAERPPPPPDPIGWPLRLAPAMFGAAVLVVWAVFGAWSAAQARETARGWLATREKHPGEFHEPPTYWLSVLPAAERADWERRLGIRPPRPADTLLAMLDDVEARAAALEARPAPECDRVFMEARRFQRGAVVFVKGDHCHVVREGAPRRRR